MEPNFFSFLMVFLASVLGSMGLGGGSLLMLYLVLFTQLPQAHAQALNLLLFIPTAAFAIFLHRKNQLLRSDLLKKNLPSGISGSILGSMVSTKLESQLLRKIFAVFLLLMGLRELWNLWQERRPKSQQNLPPKA